MSSRSSAKRALPKQPLALTDVTLSQHHALSRTPQSFSPPYCLPSHSTHTYQPCYPLSPSEPCALPSLSIPRYSTQPLLRSPLALTPHSLPFLRVKPSA